MQRSENNIFRYSNISSYSSYYNPVQNSFGKTIFLPLPPLPMLLREVTSQKMQPTEP